MGQTFQRITMAASFVAPLAMSALAFSPTPMIPTQIRAVPRCPALRMCEPVQSPETSMTEAPVAAEPVATDPVAVEAPAQVSNPLPTNSKALPFLKRPTYLDMTMAGDVGFDPLNICNSPDRLKFMRDAEVKHCRLAMLGAAGWPAGELLDAPLGKALGLTPLVEETNGLEPSILNGGLGQVSPFFWLLVLAGATYLEIGAFGKVNSEREIVGDLGFDPAGFYKGLDEAGKKSMELKEIKNGRLAMLAITGFVAQEAVTQTPIF